MNHEILCGLLIEADGYFNGKDVDAQRINDEPTIKGYCSNDGCKTNEARINALAAYILMLFKKSIRKDEYNDYDECFLMWLSDKLFKIHSKSENKNKQITLNQAYDMYLKKHKAKLDHWILFDNIQGLKNANLKYMSEFYKLLNKICITITDYSENGTESKNIIMNSTECSNQYMILYNLLSECKSHLHLLNKLKYIYDQFREPTMKEIREQNLSIPLQTLTTIAGVEMRSSKVFKSYNFSNTKCKRKVKKKTDKPSLQSSSKKESLPPKEPLKQDSPEPAPPSPQEPQPETQQSSSTTPSEEPPAKVGLSSSSLQESQKPGKNDQNEPKDSGKETGDSKSEIKGPEVGSEKKNGEDKEPRTPSGGKGSQANGGDRANSEPGGGSADKVSETGDPGKGKGDSKGGTGDVSGGDQGSPGSETRDTSNVPGGEQIDQGSPGDGTEDTKSIQDGVPDGQISNDSQGGANTSQQGTGNRGISSHQEGDTGSSSSENRSPDGGLNDKVGSGVKNGDMNGGVKEPGAPKGGEGSQVSKGDEENGKSIGTNVGKEGSEGGSGSDRGRSGSDKGGPVGDKEGPVGDKEGPGGVPGSGSGGSDNGQGVKDSEGGGIGGGGGGIGGGGGGIGGGGGGIGGGGGGIGGGGGGIGGGGGGAGSKGGGPSSDQGGNGGGQEGNDGGQGGNPGSGEQGSNSDGSSDLWKPFLKFVFNGVDNFNKASKFVNEHQQKLKDSIDKINSAYNEVKDSLKNFYDQSINDFSEFINNITDEFKQVNTPSKPGIPDNNLPQNSDNSQKSGDSPQPPSKDTSQDPPSQLPPPPPSGTPKDPPSSPSDSPKGPSPNTPQPKQPASQSQPTTQKTTQDDTFNQKKSDTPNLQLVKSSSPDPNLKKTWSIIPTTWNGSEDCKPEITFMNTTLACCTSKQCSITGIPIILVLIPIILLIVCKYLSSEWRREMTRKKNMTKVINVVGVNKTTKMVINSSDGKKQIQIIIKSSSQKKQTKKSINFVYGEKSPSLKIYQLMQADPVPFINLIFLLIFFVYKRKRDFIE
ncbi:CIR protein [Plasmodium chabaudi chabaudi]|uniref:CIR protein n=1 Tax=Plasmodium chabaudi chabaudi TaxID=31271 RepID=A0A4V0K393_PLACU|nr:CIR protein [Plasmodium chabaudi chabaudi]VTZ67340.1 CIR protein [Plasmodium chabaudi chabaudi]|eukprot:XP_016655128.1 CIR protein [Plasmodium chabaudi chabaudi]